MKAIPFFVSYIFLVSSAYVRMCGLEACWRDSFGWGINGNATTWLVTP
jgi:hypothetical protein